MGTILLIGLYIACELTANITAGKPVELFGLVAPGGVFIYALTFTLIDLIHERLGRERARHIVYAAGAANLLLAGYTALIVALPFPAFYEHQDAFASTLGSTSRIVAASLVAYLSSSLVDLEIYAIWKRAVGRHRWARVLVSNGVSTGVDSVLFVMIAFGGVLPVIPLILGQYAVKMAVTVVSVPMIYAVRPSTGVPPDA